MKIYLVIGDDGYEESDIIGCFLSKELAEAFVETMSFDNITKDFIYDDDSPWSIKIGQEWVKISKSQRSRIEEFRYWAIITIQDCDIITIDNYWDLFSTLRDRC